ncbi:hypothetical protein BDFB_012882, partial [Asbolus verrucosus]
MKENNLTLNQSIQCHKKGHTVNECYKKHPNRNQVRDYTENSRKIHVNQPTNDNTNISNRQNKFCRYCKNPGHLFDECRKREYNNRKFQNQERTNSSTSTTPRSETVIEIEVLNPEIKEGICPETYLHTGVYLPKAVVTVIDNKALTTILNRTDQKVKIDNIR